MKRSIAIIVFIVLTFIAFNASAQSKSSTAKSVAKKEVKQKRPKDIVERTFVSLTQDKICGFVTITFNGDFSYLMEFQRPDQYGYKSYDGYYCVKGDMLQLNVVSPKNDALIELGNFCLEWEGTNIICLSKLKPSSTDPNTIDVEYKVKYRLVN